MKNYKQNMLYMLKANKYFGVIKFILGGYNYMRFDNEELFKELVKKYGMNLFVGAGFSVYAYNEDKESLPLGEEINKKLIKLFSLDNGRKFNLSKTCQKIKINNSDMLEKN